MPLQSGLQLGVYKVAALIGAGGMGEVYRAHDGRLKRDVALKILPADLSHDHDRLSRFQREAELLASLNHPSIAAVYGFDEIDGMHVLVMELVEGETLVNRLADAGTGRGVPIVEALGIALQIADALEAAHERGVIHRDLKPANIKIMPDGKVKVLDFGLAKAFAVERSSMGMTNSPTLSVAATNAGMILGTAAYMSPEQARGRPVDKRTDIFSFGVVLYELLSGQQVFPGETITEVLARVIEREPDWTRLPKGLSPRIDELLRRCLEKDVSRRRRDMGDVRIEIERALAEPAGPAASAAPSAPRRTSRLAWAVAGVVAVVAVAAAAAAIFLRPSSDARQELRLDIVTPATPDVLSLAISPDGRRVAYVAAGDADPRLWVRTLSALTAQPVSGTEGTSYPFWSPDSQSIGFFSGGKLKRVDLGGGVPQTLADAPSGRGGTWAGGVILFAATSGAGLSRVSASGGDVAPVTSLAGTQMGTHRFPQFLPDGRRFLFLAQGSPDTQGVYIGSVDAPGLTRLVASETAGAYLAPGWLLYVHQGTLFARAFNASSGTTTGEPIVVADSVAFDGGFGLGAFATSRMGLVAYRTGGVTRRQLTWFDRSGKATGTVGDLDDSILSRPQISPDGRRVAVDRQVQNNNDVWLLDGSRVTRFTFDPADDHGAIWSPDGSQVVFDSSRKGGDHQLYIKPSSGAGTEELLFESPGSKGVADWSPDGRFILFGNQDPKTGFNLQVVSLADRKPRPFLQTAFDERLGQFSPDGRWIAYQSNESGRYEIYVRPFPGPGGQWQVSTSGGIMPRWRRDGKELYYISPDARLMAAPIALSGALVQPGTPVALFRTRMVGGGASAGFRPEYDVSADGRFLIDVAADAVAAPITLLLNWRAAAR